MNIRKKKVFFIGQTKGGVGKTFLTSLYLLKHRFYQNSNSPALKTVFFDIDTANKTFYNRFSNKYDNVKEFSIYQSNRTDYTMFYFFFETIAASDYEEVFCDLGSIESQEILLLFNEDIFKEFIEELGIEIVFLTVFRLYPGDNDCLNYFKKFVASTPNFIKKVCVLNGININKHNTKQRTNLIELQRECSITENLVFKNFGLDLDLQQQEKVNEYIAGGFNGEIEFAINVIVLGLIEEINLDS